MQIPPYPHDPQLNDKLDFAQKEEAEKLFSEFPEEKAFSLRDLH